MTQTVTTKAKTKAASTAIKAGGKAIVINIHNDVSSAPHVRARRHLANYPSSPSPYVLPHVITTNPRLPQSAYNIPSPIEAPSIAGYAATAESHFDLPPSVVESPEVGPEADSESSLYRSADEAEYTRDHGNYDRNSANRSADLYSIPIVSQKSHPPYLKRIRWKAKRPRTSSNPMLMLDVHMTRRHSCKQQTGQRLCGLG